jgi:hypothetical protein
VLVVTDLYCDTAMPSPPLEPYDPEADPSLKETLDIIKIANEVVHEAINKLLEEAVDKVIKEDE